MYLFAIKKVTAISLTNDIFYVIELDLGFR